MEVITGLEQRGLPWKRLPLIDEDQRVLRPTFFVAVEALGRVRGGILEPTVAWHDGDGEDAAGQIQSEARNEAYGEETGAISPAQVHLY